MVRVYYTDGTSADKQAATGCVATASAIIMKYYEYPKSVTGGVSVFSLTAFRDPNNVSWNLTEHSYPVSYASYDWDLMKDEYVKGNYSEAEAKAVADLMWNIEANVEMVYGYPESETNTQYAISRYKK